jgi:hypothetical protein
MPAPISMPPASSRAPPRRARVTTVSAKYDTSTAIASDAPVSVSA